MQRRAPLSPPPVSICGAQILGKDAILLAAAHSQLRLPTNVWLTLACASANGWTLTNSRSTLKLRVAGPDLPPRSKQVDMYNLGSFVKIETDDETRKEATTKELPVSLEGAIVEPWRPKIPRAAATGSTLSTLTAMQCLAWSRCEATRIRNNLVLPPSPSRDSTRCEMNDATPLMGASSLGDAQQQLREALRLLDSPYWVTRQEAVEMFNTDIKPEFLPQEEEEEKEATQEKKEKEARKTKPTGNGASPIPPLQPPPPAATVMLTPVTLPSGKRLFHASQTRNPGRFVDMYCLPPLALMLSGRHHRHDTAIAIRRQLAVSEANRRELVWDTLSALDDAGVDLSEWAPADVALGVVDEETREVWYPLPAGCHDIRRAVLDKAVCSKNM
jgi:hypothetical protein